MFDGYDTGIRYADLHIGHIVETLRACGVYDVTAIMISSDHGETLGELGIYCDHQTADEHVTHVPCIVRWPEDDPRRVAVDPALHYQIDVTATLLNLLGMDVPDSWDGRSFAPSLATGAPAGREFLVLTQGAWTAQRAVRFDDWIFIRTYDAGYHGFPDTMLFNLASDPHEQSDQSAAHPEVVLRAQGLLDSWLDEAFAHGPTRVDPLETVIAEGGPWHARGRPDGYFDHLRATGRGAWADVLEAR
jgi:arylsulfatase A-like enzyme